MALVAGDRDVDGFLALLAARHAPATVEAYRRDLTALRAFLNKPVASATVEDLERFTAELRARGLSSATIARRTAAARMFFRHLQLLGAREDNPAAEVALPPRTRRLPRTLSPGEAERLIDAASGAGPVIARSSSCYTGRACGCRKR
jgi:integrase/recombinase XerD